MSWADQAPANRYSVREVDGDQGWEVHIVDPQGHTAWSRSCTSRDEARTFASTVRQHVYWLSEEKFREYYRLEAPA